MNKTIDMTSIKNNLILKDDIELIEILKKNNEDEWQDGVFEIIEEILINRGIKPPEREKAKIDDNKNTDSIIIDKTHKYYGVKGWLLFFCTIQLFFKPALFIFLWVSSSNQLGRVFKSYPALKTISIIETLVGTIILIYGIEIGVTIIKKKFDAVKAAKTFLLVNMAITIILGIIPFFASLPTYIQKYFGSQFMKNSAGALIFLSIWFLYFNKSKRVKATFPVNEV